MQFLVSHWSGFILLLAALLGMIEVGRWLGQRHMRVNPNWDNRGVNTLENALLALLGLLLAFTFSGAWARFDTRRELILQETNAVGTAWLRLDLLPGPARESLRDALRRYVDLRIADTKANAVRASAEAQAAQQAIWAEAVAAARAAEDNRVAQLLLPTLNDMFDLAATRHLAVQTHPPAVIFVMLLAMMLLACLLAGYGMAGSNQRNWLHMLSFVSAMLLAVYVTVDLEFPRRGLVRIDHFDELLVELRAGMK